MSTNTNGIVKRPQVVLGQAIDPTDFMALSGWSRAYINDVVMGAVLRRQRLQFGPTSMVIDPFDGTTTSTAPAIYAIGHSGAIMSAFTARAYGCNPGAIFYVAATPTVDGVTPKVLCYNLQQNEITGQLAAGSAANPRFDAIYVRLSEVSAPTVTRNFEDAAGVKTSQAIVPDLRVKLEWQVVAGTPAVSPQIPAAPDATWASWGVVYVTKNFGAGTSFSAPFIYDYRIPVGLNRYNTVPGGGLFAVGGGATASLANGNVTFASTGIGAACAAVCPAASGRLMGSQFTFGTFASGLPRLAQRGILGTAPPWYFDIYSGSHAGDPTMPLSDLDGYTLDGGLWYNASGNVVTTSASGLALLPVWTNGRGSLAMDAATTSPNYMSNLFLPATTGETVYSCVFDVTG